MPRSYWDILPNPVTRVRLPIEDGDISSDYVNANFIRGYGGRGAKHYIAAQGPLASSLEQFLRMIWHSKVTVIVMIAGLWEGGREKCSRYFPDDPGHPLTIGPFIVTLRDIADQGGFLKNRLTIRNVETGESVNISHYWFNSWPDHGVPCTPTGEVNPENALDCLSLARNDREAQDNADAPILVHCSAGIGQYIRLARAAAGARGGFARVLVLQSVPLLTCVVACSLHRCCCRANRDIYHD